MAKKVKATKKPKAKVKKIRTAEEKAARNIRRKARRDSRKHTAKLKATIEAKNPTIISTETPLSVFPWKEKVTSDGLPYSKSIDNPDSLLGQLKRERDREAAEAASKTDEAKKKRMTPIFAPIAKECIIHSIM